MVALAHGAGSADDGPDGDGAAERDEGFFAQAAPNLFEAVFIVEVSGGKLVTRYAEASIEEKHTRSGRRMRAAGRCWDLTWADLTWWCGGGGGVAWVGNSESQVGIPFQTSSM